MRPISNPGRSLQGIVAIVVRGGGERACEAGLDQWSFVGVGDDPELAAAYRLDGAGCDVCRRQPGGSGERLADGEAHGFSDFGTAFGAAICWPSPFGFHDSCVDRARAQHADTDRHLVDGQLLGEGLGDRYHGDFGGGVGADEGDAAEQSGDGGGVDDVAWRALLAHDRQEASQPVMTPHRLTSNTQCQSSRVWSCSRLNMDTPALLHRTSTRLNRSSVDAASWSSAAASETSTVSATAEPPAARMPVATLSASVPSRSATTTAEPAAANASARACPIPLAAPVTTATRPSPITSFEGSVMSVPPFCSAAVEHDELAGQLGRRVAGEVEGGADDLAGVGDASEGDARCHLRLQLF
jgi:hypothetical protein